MRMPTFPPAPIPVDGTNTAAVVAPTGERPTASVCARCQTSNPPGEQRCSSCRSFLPANQMARTSGAYAKFQPEEILLTADQTLEGIVSDLGGVDEMTTLEKGLAGRLRDVDILLGLNKRVLIVEGTASPTGRKAHERYLACLDRYVRIAGMLGLTRRPKQATSLSAYLSARAEPLEDE